MEVQKEYWGIRKKWNSQLMRDQAHNVIYPSQAEAEYAIRVIETCGCPMFFDIGENSIDYEKGAYLVAFPLKVEGE